MKRKTSIMSLIMCLSKAVDLISPLVSKHHEYVMCTAFQLCREMGLDEEEQKDIVCAAALHDIGALSLAERVSALDFNFEEERGHAERGYQLLNTYKPFSNIAGIVRYHHTRFSGGRQGGEAAKALPLGSRILNVADRISVLIKPDGNILGQTDKIRKTITDLSGTLFSPEVANAFARLSKKECFWLDIVSGSLYNEIKNSYSKETPLKEHDLSEIIRLFSKIIDFRSRFTSTHSSGVAATAKAIAKKAGFLGRDLKKMELAGLIHDLGKLAVPVEILEKQGSLTKEEFEIVRTHTYYTNMILLDIRELDEIREWGALHHERLNGEGYPFHYDKTQLSQGSRIMAVADVFVGLSEDRPYRKALEREKILLILKDMVRTNALDESIVGLVIENFSYINNCRKKAQKKAGEEFIKLQ